MADIFNRLPLQYGGSFAADAASMNFGTNAAGLGSGGGTGLVTQSLQVSYQQPITRLYEVGTQFTYYIAGRPQGSINLARVLGPGSVSTAFYEVFGDVCLADQNHLVFDVAAGCSPAGALVSNRIFYLANNVLMQSVGISVQAQDMIINEAISMMFTSLEAFDDENQVILEELTLYGTSVVGGL